MNKTPHIPHPRDVLLRLSTVGVAMLLAACDKNPSSPTAAEGVASPPQRPYVVGDKPEESHRAKSVPAPDLEDTDPDDPMAADVKISLAASTTINALSQDVELSVLTGVANTHLEQGKELEDPFLVLVPTIGDAIYRKLFDRRCRFEPEEKRKLRQILESELDGSLKNELLRIGSASGEGNVETSVRVFDSALQYGGVEPKTLASILRDIARMDPDRAIKEITSRPWNSNLGPGTSMVFAEYVISNPERGSAEALALGAVPAYQWAAAGVVQAIRGVDPEAAQTWREQITDTDAAEHADAMTYSLRTGP